MIYVNDCGSQDEDFLPLLQSEGGSGVLCVQEIASQHSLQWCSCYCSDGGDTGGGGPDAELPDPQGMMYLLLDFWPTGLIMHQKLSSSP